MQAIDPIDEFLEQLPGFHSWNGKKQTDYLAYHLEKLASPLGGVSVTLITLAFQDARVKPYSRIRQYLWEEAEKTRGGNYVRAAGKYILSRARHSEIEAELGKDVRVQQVTGSLSVLAAKVTDPGESEFLGEVIRCYQNGINRSAVVSMWTLTMAHLRNKVLSSKLVDFNSAIDIWNMTHPKAQIDHIGDYEDFGEIPEHRFIELLKISKVVTKQERELLDERLKTRNAAGHPTTFKIGPHTVTEYIASLVDNVLS